jgi:hypothetical protein
MDIQSDPRPSVCSFQKPVPMKHIQHSWSCSDSRQTERNPGSLPNCCTSLYGLSESDADSLITPRLRHEDSTTLTFMYCSSVSSFTVWAILHGPATMKSLMACIYSSPPYKLLPSIMTQPYSVYGKPTPVPPPPCIKPVQFYTPRFWPS